MGFPVKRFSCLCFFLKSRTENCFLDLYLILNILMKTVGFVTPSIKGEEKSHITTFPEKRVIWKGLMCAMFWTVNLFFADTRHCVGHIQGLSRMHLKITFPGIRPLYAGRKTDGAPRRLTECWPQKSADFTPLPLSMYNYSQEIKECKTRNVAIGQSLSSKNVLNRPKIISLQNSSEKW